MQERVTGDGWPGISLLSEGGVTAMASMLLLPSFPPTGQALEGFGVVTLASILPILAVELVRLSYLLSDLPAQAATAAVTDWKAQMQSLFSMGCVGGSYVI